MHAIVKNKLLVVTYALTILYALHYGIPLYATSTYLHVYFSSQLVSALYMIGSISALIASIHVAKYIKRFHTYQFTVGLAALEILSVIAFGYTSRLYLLALFFVIHFILQTLLYVCLNIFIESFSKHAQTGSVRGLFLTLLNAGILVSPVIGGTVLSHYTFTMLYLVSALTLVPFIFLLRQYFMHISEPAYHSVDLFEALKSAWRKRSLRTALVAALTIQCFYAVIVIYSPIYLQFIGVSLSTYMAVILPFALLPLVLLPYELGYLADTRFGEKEMLIGGLSILAFTVFLCVIVTSPNPLVWIAIFVLSRIGAACVETMAFTYYFKKIGPEDAALTALFSNTQAAATILVGGIGILISPLLNQRPQLIFIVLGCAILWCISYVLPMRDTR